MQAMMRAPTKLPPAPAAPCHPGQADSPTKLPASIMASMRTRDDHHAHAYDYAYDRYQHEPEDEAASGNAEPQDMTPVQDELAAATSRRTNRSAAGDLLGMSSTVAHALGSPQDSAARCMPAESTPAAHQTAKERRFRRVAESWRRDKIAGDRLQAIMISEVRRRRRRRRHCHRRLQ